jgi:hypothetical protein
VSHAPPWRVDASAALLLETVKRNELAGCGAFTEFFYLLVFG